MLLDHLKDFEWYNDPFDVFFNDKGMQVTSFEQTDFWQSIHHKTERDNGHFFFTRKHNDFSFVACWEFDNISQFDQCGIMVRLDNRNWAKISIMNENNQNPKLGTCVTQKGYSDLVIQDIAQNTNKIWYKIKRINGDYLIFYSLDGIKFQQIRIFHFINELTEVKTGIYICSPHKKSFTATLVEMHFD